MGVVGDELGALEAALERLSSDEVCVLSDHPNRRRVVRVGDAVVKAYSAAEEAAWDREVRALRCLSETGLTPALLDYGPLWLAMEWRDDAVVPEGAIDSMDLHERLGSSLAALHAVVPYEMCRWPITDRLSAHLNSRLGACPARLFDAACELAISWMDLAEDGRFVHGDWGTNNVLVNPNGSSKTVVVIDLEDAHLGDPAEDFKWQVLAGPRSADQAAMAAGYRAAGGSLGAHAAERLGLFAIELCLEVLTWDLGDADTTRRFWDRCIGTLNQLVDGKRPIAP